MEYCEHQPELRAPPERRREVLQGAALGGLGKESSGSCGVEEREQRDGLPGRGAVGTR